MNTTAFDPTQLTARQLADLGEHALHQLALRACGTLSAYRLLLGRCLLAMHHCGHFDRFGCSSAIHYATAILGMKAKEARMLRRIACLLEDLPQLSRAAHEGSIEWSKLREVVAVATAETERFWIEACATMTYAQIERLASLTPCGEFPQLPEGPDTRPVRTEIHCTLPSESMQVLERALQSLAQESGRVLSLSEALEFLAAEYLARRPLDEQALEEQRKQARKDLAARHDRDRTLLEKCPVRDIFEATVAAKTTPCPGNPELELPQREKPHWENPRLRPNPDSRLPTPAQRADILRRDGYQCSTPGCPHQLYLQVHHIAFYCHKGQTLPRNLALLCGKCHRHVHEGKLRVEGQPGNLKFYDGQGRDLQRICELSAAEWLDFWVGWQGGECDGHVQRWHDGKWTLPADQPE